MFTRAPTVFVLAGAWLSSTALFALSLLFASQRRNDQKKRSKKPHLSLPLEHVQREDASDGRLGCGLAFALHPLLTDDLTLAG